jgi:hypothetical protein
MAINVSLSANIVISAMLAGRKLADERFRGHGDAEAAEMPITDSEARGLAPMIVQSSSDDVLDVVAALMLKGARQRWTELARR